MRGCFSGVLDEKLQIRIQFENLKKKKQHMRLINSDSLLILELKFKLRLSCFIPEKNSALIDISFWNREPVDQIRLQFYKQKKSCWSAQSV